MFTSNIFPYCFALAVATSVSTSALACKDSLTLSSDKQIHFGVSMALGAGGRALLDDNKLVLATVLGAGVLKEVVDAHSSTGCASASDLAYDALGAVVGIYGTNWIIRKNYIGYRMTF